MLISTLALNNFLLFLLCTDGPLMNELVSESGPTEIPEMTRSPSEHDGTNQPDSALTDIQAEEHRDTQAAPGIESQQLTVSEGTEMIVNADQLIGTSTVTSVSEDQLIAPSTVTPRTFKRKLEEAHLPPTKRVGRPRKAKALDHYKYTSKPFNKKNKLEQTRGEFSMIIR
jgi:hypothetical protein